MKRPTLRQEDMAAATGCSDEDFVKDFPTLCQWLSDSRWEDGSVRELATLTISVVSGSVQLALNDKGGKKSVYTTAGSIAEAMELLDNALREETVVWRLWKISATKK